MERDRGRRAQSLRAALRAARPASARAAEELEDPRPPTFAQGVGFVVTIVGVSSARPGSPPPCRSPPSLAFVAAFLNAAFGYCLGCQLYLLLVRARVIRRA